MKASKSFRVILLMAGLLVFSAGAFATTCDLTLNLTSECTDLNGAIYTNDGVQSTGTGVIDPFLRIQANGTEQGYNTSSQKAVFDDKTGIWTHDLVFSNLIPVQRNGQSYYQFNLDINQDGNNPLLSLDSVQIFRSDLVYATNAPASLGQFGTALYTMNFGGDSVIMDYNLNPGSGAGDMMLFVPAALLQAGTGQYLYLYSSFGGLETCPAGLANTEGGSKCSSNDGFEEWYQIVGTTEVPEPATLMLLGTGLVGLGAKLRRRMKKA